MQRDTYTISYWARPGECAISMYDHNTMRTFWQLRLWVYTLVIMRRFEKGIQGKRRIEDRI